jgi:Arylsulfotransferase (ASST)
VHLDSHGNLLVDARDTWATYDVSRRTGKILWTLGGKRSTFVVRAAPGQVLDCAGEIFAWQHDPDQVGPQTYTWFDDESSGTPLLPVSRAVTVRLNFRSRTVTLVASDNRPEGLVASSQGNAQTTATGDLFVGWGNLPYFSEFSPSGRLLCNAELPAGVNSYRAYQLPWPGR